MEIYISFVVPGLDPIGDSRFWYRWAFFDTANGVVPSDIRGNPEPYFYGTYVSVTDFYRTDEFLNIFYIMLALSLFWLLGEPFVWGWGVYLQFDYILQSIEISNLFGNWPGSANYQTNLYLIMFLGWIEIWVASNIIMNVTLLPGPFSLFINFFVVLYMYISYLYQSGTNDKRLYYKSKEDELIVPAIIDHDAFFDIHFRDL